MDFDLLTGFPNSNSSLRLGDEILLLPHQIDYVCLLQILGWNKQISLVSFSTKEKLGSAIHRSNHQSHPNLAKTIDLSPNSFLIKKKRGK
jgi:hypothetical protein